MYKLRLRKSVFPGNRIRKYKSFKSFGGLVCYLLDHMFELSSYCIDVVVGKTLYCSFSPSSGLSFTGKISSSSLFGSYSEVKYRSILGQLFSIYIKK